MLFSQLVDVSNRIGATNKRLEKIELLASLLRQTTPEEAETAVAFLSGGARQGRIGIGYATLSSAAGEATAEPALSLMDVDSALGSLLAISGTGSESRRRAALLHLFSRATAGEQHFLRRLLVGELRQGALEGVMLEGLAKAAGLSADRVRRAAMMAGGVASIARAVLDKGEPGLAQYDIQLFRPVQPMLAGTADDTGCAIEELGEAALEYKVDGARIQVHKSGGQVAIYTRQLNDVTAAIPEVADAVRALPVRDLILDGEAIGLMPDGRPQPFQISMRRFGRKLDVSRLQAELPMVPFWFDVLYLDGTSLLDEPQSVRFGQLRQIVSDVHLVPNLITKDAERAEDFLHRSLGSGHEGIMMKSPSSVYAAGARGQSWLKIKKAKTLDLVILAAEWGSGRRQGFLSNLHLGARDTESGGFAMLGKTFKGLTDKMLAWQTAELLKLEIARDRYAVHVEPKIVVEIAFNEIQVSTRYKSGLALRFARVKRYRNDKTAADSDTYQSVKMLAGLA